MPFAPITTNTLFYGDNLAILRDYIADQSVDLVYLDPPFNSSRNYNVLFKDESGKDSEAQIVAFEDTWHWPGAMQTYHDLITDGPPHAVEMMKALHSMVGPTPMMAYLVMMAARLVELHRVLKPTGSLYLHCDQNAAHYLKVILDCIFDPTGFRNEIIWKRTSAHNDPKRYGVNVDILLFYTKSQVWTWNEQYTTHSEEYIARFRNVDANGRRWQDDNLTAKGLAGGGYDYEYKGFRSLWRCPLETMERLDAENRLHFTRTGGIRLKRYLDENLGTPLQVLWGDISPINSQAAERLGYPTQKPLALLERIIQASSNPGDLVIDPFCGCGTTVAAAQKLGRRWIGIDITTLAIALQENRLKSMFANATYKTEGLPTDIAGAQWLAHHDRYQFQWWALFRVGAKPLGGQEGSKTGKKGSDKGIDGVINFIDEAPNKAKRILVQVKSGHVKSGDIRDLVGTIQREGAAIGVFITLEPPTRDMVNEAASAGFYTAPFTKQTYPRLQILTITELLHGATIKMPVEYGTFKQAQRVQPATGEQLGMEGF